MANRLIQEAQKFVQLAKTADANEQRTAVTQAKNALVSAFANSTISEQHQLRELQNELESIK